MRAAGFTIVHGGASSSLIVPHVPVWLYDGDNPDKVWLLIRRKGSGSYAHGPGPRSQQIVLEEYDAPDARGRIDRLQHLSWIAWAAHELRGILTPTA